MSSAPVSRQDQELKKTVDYSEFSEVEQDTSLSFLKKHTDTIPSINTKLKQQDVSESLVCVC